MPESNKINRVILMGKKPGAAKALKWLKEQGITVPLVVAQKDEGFKINLEETARELNIPIIYDDEELYNMIRDNHELIRNIDLVVSYLYWKRVLMPLINLPRLGCLNFHPAILPDYKSRAGYNTAILEKKEEFGATAHFIDSEKFDAGPIIKVAKFPIDHETETAFSLERKTQNIMFDLFKNVITLFMGGEQIRTTENSGGLYLTSQQLEAMKIVDITKESPEDIDRKVRAFFFPPYHGAKIIMGDKEFTLVNSDILRILAKIMKDAE